MEAIALMMSERFSFKQIGYILMAVFLDQTNDLSVLVTQTLMRDLGETAFHSKSLALAFVANLGWCRAVASEVRKLLTDRSAHLQKRAVMATVRIVRMSPDPSESYKNVVQPLLNSSNHGS